MKISAPKVGRKTRALPDQSSTLIDLLRAMVLTPCNRFERFHVAYFDEAQNLIGDKYLGQGNSCGLSVRMREVLSVALELNAYGLILAHNHPSGRCQPSKTDIEATKRLSRVAHALDVAVIDHLIFTNRSVYSMRAGGVL